MIYFLLSFLIFSISGSEQSTTFNLQEAGNFGFEGKRCSSLTGAMAFVENDSKLMIAHANKIMIINCDNNRSKYYSLPFNINYADIHTKENKLAALVWQQKIDNYDLQIYDPVCQKILLSYNLVSDSHSWQPVAWHPTGTMVVVSNLSDYRNCPHIIDVRSGEIAKKLDNPSESLAHCKFSPDGNYLAGATLHDKSVIIWNMATGVIERKITFADHTYDIYWSLDQKCLLVSKLDGAVAIQMSDGAVYEKFSKEFINENRGVFIDNSRFLFSETSNMLELFNTNTCKKRDILQSKDNEIIDKLALTENGRTLAVAIFNKRAEKIDTIKLFDVNR